MKRKIVLNFFAAFALAAAATSMAQAPATVPTTAPAHVETPTSAPAHAAQAAPTAPAGAGSLQRLIEGNARFVSGTPTHPRIDAARRTETAAGQHPFATVIACSDSRSPVEDIFDQGVGDVFVVRVAGNVAATDEIASAEYAAEHLHSPLLVVMGHTKCGAVTAAVTNAPVGENIARLVNHIAPAARKARAQNPSAAPDKLVAAAVNLNVLNTVHDLLSHSPVLREQIEAGKVKVAGAIYDLETGTVEWIDIPIEPEKAETAELVKDVQPPATPAAPPAHAAAHAAAPAGPTPDAVIQQLKEGNALFVADRAPKSDDSPARRAETAKGQHPVAAILSCSDSRVPVERVFDRGVGELFVVRVAGNVAADDEIASAEYAVEHLNTPVLVVMGHSKCGAVTAVVADAKTEGSIPALLENVKPAVAAARSASPAASGDALVAAAIRCNVLQSVENLLRRSEAIRERVESGNLKVVGAVYDIATGSVDWVGPHPRQSQVLASLASSHAPAGGQGSSHASNAPPQATHGSSADSGPAAHVSRAVESPAPAHAAEPTPAAPAYVAPTPAYVAPTPAAPTVTRTRRAGSTADSPAALAADDGWSWWTIGGIAAAVVVAGAIIFFVFCRREDGGFSATDPAGAYSHRSNSQSTFQTSKQGNVMNLKLSAKLALGFGSLVAITLGLGTLAVVKMKASAAGAQELATKFVPETDVAARINEATAEVAINVRSYGFTGEQKYIDNATTAMVALKDGMKEADELVTKFPELAKLKEELGKAKPLLVEYEKLVTETVQKNKEIAAARDAMNKAGAAVNQDLSQLNAGQLVKQADEIASKADAEKLSERAAKLALLSEIDESVGEARIAAFKGQALRQTELIRDADKVLAAADEKFAKLHSMMKAPADQREIEDARVTAQGYRKALAQLAADAVALDEIGSRRGKISAEFGELISAILSKGVERTIAEANGSFTSLSSASTILLIGLGVAAVVGVGVAVTLTRSITKPINRIIGSLSAGAEQTRSASGQVSASSQSLAQGASEQAASLEETSSSLEEMSSMTKKNADVAQQAASLSGEAKQAADRGNQSMTKMSTAINDIQKSAGETAKIIKVIDEIAFQTNLLALNAAVEAARAGEAGKGFAVVAEEVRNLAMRSAEAAKNTSSLIEESVQNSRNGVTIADEVGKVLADITAAATKVNALVGEIAAASSEQARGIDQVNTAVAQMDKVTQSNAANAEESAAASEELSSQAEQLMGVVGELIQIVGGAQRFEAAPSAPRHTTRHAASNSAAPARRPATSKHAKSNAESVIPFGDSHGSQDFSEFSKAA